MVEPSSQEPGCAKSFPCDPPTPYQILGCHASTGLYQAIPTIIPRIRSRGAANSRVGSPNGPAYPLTVDFVEFRYHGDAFDP
jgi:hypothetical protein